MTASKKSARRRRRQVTTERLKVRRPDELLAIIPLPVGFHPDESIVVVLIRSGSDRAGRPDRSSAESAGDELAEQIDYLAKRHEAPALALVGVQRGLLAGAPAADSADGSAGRTQADRRALCRARSVVVTQLWRGLLPAQRNAVRSQLPPTSAAAVFAGLGTRANRQELEASVSGPPQAELPRLEAWLRPAHRARAPRRSQCNRTAHGQPGGDGNVRPGCPR